MKQLYHKKVNSSAIQYIIKLIFIYFIIIWLQLQLNNNIIYRTTMSLLLKNIPKYNIFKKKPVPTTVALKAKRLFEKNQESKNDVHARRYLELNQKQSGSAQMKYYHKYYDDFNFKQLNLKNLKIEKYEDLSTFHLIPRLKHDLEKVIQGGIHEGNFGIHPAQPDQLDLDRMNLYIPPSKDKKLSAIAKKNNLKYIMSTSTISTVLSHFYYIFSKFRQPCFDVLSPAFDNQPRKYMISFRKPVTLIMRKHGDNMYSLDSDKGFFQFQEPILMEMGKIMENQLIMTQQEFDQRFRKNVTVTTPPPNPEICQQHHRHMFVNNELCLRSQIDCVSYDKDNKPFVFQIKTRAVCPIRYDLNNYRKFLDYQIKTPIGSLESFERQYFDLIRGGFIKYAFQVQIGDMHGALVAYHNTLKIFGYEYVTKQEMSRRIFGNQYNLNIAFVTCCKMLTNVLDTLLEDLKKQQYQFLRIGFYANNLYDCMNIVVELSDEDFAEQQRIKLTDEIRDELDYFTKVKPFKNKVLKYQFKYFMYINGALVSDSEFLLEESDTVEMKYSFKRCYQMPFLEYMNFLHEAYKFENMTGDYNYSGVWMKQQSG